MSESWRFAAARLTESFCFFVILGAALVWTTRLRSFDWRRRIDALAGQPRRAMVIAALLTLTVAVLAQQLAPSPPEIHDEFSNLLLADTLVSGRLSNPTHPLWRHFESFHILQQPSYASKYPPALGIAIALGRVLSGSAEFGVALLHAAAAAALVWMLLGWTTRRWAFIGGVLFATLPPIQIEWTRSFMGSGAAILGACLVLGAVKRLRDSRRAVDGVWLALGLIILANSRPFEGFVFGAVSLVWLVVALYWPADRPTLLQTIRLAAPPLGTLAVGAVLMSAYCYAVTGHWTRLPYAEYQQQYSVSPVFVWQPPLEVQHEHSNNEFRNFYEYFERRFYDKQQEWGTFWKFKSLSLGASLLQLVNPSLALVLILSLIGLMDSRCRLLWLLLAAQSATSMGVVWLQETYIAPMIAPLFVLITHGLRRLSLWRRGEGQGGALVVGAGLSHGVALAAALIAASGSPPSDWSLRREKIQEAMRREGGKHLITVVYSAGHNPHIEWVYNEADIDAASVVWARYLDDASNAQLFNYYADRTQWLLLADKYPPELIPVEREGS